MISTLGLFVAFEALIILAISTKALQPSCQVADLYWPLFGEDTCARGGGNSQIRGQEK
jgi:hypothetical protein